LSINLDDNKFSDENKKSKSVKVLKNLYEGARRNFLRKKLKKEDEKEKDLKYEEIPKNLKKKKIN
jgi:hypothetical protein